jgi:hypothetical protein
MDSSSDVWTTTRSTRGGHEQTATRPEREETSGRITQQTARFLVRVKNCEVSESEAQPIRAGVALR